MQRYSLTGLVTILLDTPLGIIVEALSLVKFRRLSLLAFLFFWGYFKQLQPLCKSDF